MNIGSSRKRRPLPIQVSKFEDRQEGDKDDPTPRSKSPLLPTIASTSHPTSLAPKFSFNRSVVSQEPTRTTNILHTSATISTQRKSPTRTTFITVTQSIESPKEKEGDSPGPTQTVFLSASAQIVTVTVSTVVTVPTGKILPPSVPQTKGIIVIPARALIPVIVFSVVAGIALIIIIAIIVWKKKKGKDRRPAEQRPKPEFDNGGFQVVPDRQPILS